MTEVKRILVIGLAGHARGTSATSMMPSGTFRGKIKQQVAEAKRLGFELDIIQVKPSDFNTKVRSIKEHLKQKPHGCMIGNGIRGTGTIEYTKFFEALVNACREITPGTKLLFNTSPLDIAETCKRLS